MLETLLVLGSSVVGALIGSIIGVETYTKIEKKNQEEIERETFELLKRRIQRYSNSKELLQQIEEIEKLYD